jgi:threonine synthase
MTAPSAAQRKHFDFRCHRCGEIQPPGFVTLCCRCGGMVEARYDLGSAKIHDAPRSMERFFDLLPISDPVHLVNLGEGQTPCLSAENLAGDWGLRGLYLKMESANPTGTTKDRMAAAVLSMFREMGITEFVSCSTGNSSSALARGISLVEGFTMRLFVGEEFAPRLRFVANNAGIDLRVLSNSSFTEAFDFARTEAEKRGLAFEAGFFNPARREGLKLAYFEAVEQVPENVTHYFQAVSSAMGLQGSWKGARELHALGRTSVLPKMVGVQQQSCNPMVRAWRESSRVILPHHIIPNAQGPAKAILRGNPSGSYPYVHEAVKESGGALEDVSEEEMFKLRTELEAREDIRCGWCSAAALAAVRKMMQAGTLDPDSVVLVNMTD